MLDKLIEFKENDFTRDLVLPLFEKIYSCRVAFSGGSYEKGRDLIVYYKNLLGNNEFIGIQVKKIEATPNSTTKSFQQLLNQLEQLKSETVTCPSTGEKVKISKLIFITPFEIPEKSFDTHSGAFKAVVEKGVDIIDGKKLLLLIDKHYPDLKRVIAGDGVYIGNKLKTKLTNKALMDALHLTKTKELCEVYCEASLELGNNREQNQLTEFVCNSQSIIISQDGIDDLFTLNKMSSNTLGFHFYNQEELEKAQFEFRKKSQISYAINELHNKQVDLKNKIKKVISYSPFTKLFPKPVEENFEKFIKSEFRKVNLPDDKFEEFFQDVTAIQKLLSDDLSLREELLNLRSQDSEFLNEHKIKFQGDKLLALLDSSVEALLEYEKQKSTNLKQYFKLSRVIETCHRLIQHHDDKFQSTAKTFARNPPQISIKEVFDSRLNIIVLGDAGSGKTTNLQVYAKTLLEKETEKLIIYITLSELAGFMYSGSNSSILDGICGYLSSIGINDFSFESLNDVFKHKETCLILDSVDEAIVQYQTILKDLSEFANLYSLCQIITSSRFNVSDVPTLGFVNISLLPFSQQQKSNFFTKWFYDNPSLVEDIMAHLQEHPELNNVVTNPLSATIMASLASSSVPLPTSEATLYKKRFELLSGVFDKFKGVNRMKSPPEIILSCCQQLAYIMHSGKHRELRRETFISHLTDITGSESQAKLIFEELVSPCEILLVNPNGKYGFGHLRFQEFLVSEHIVKLRKLPIDKMLSSSWWHDVFLLYSQHAFEIEWLVDYVTNNGISKRHRKLIQKMINYRVNSKENELLSKRFEIALKQEINNPNW